MPWPPSIAKSVFLATETSSKEIWSPPLVTRNGGVAVAEGGIREFDSILTLAAGQVEPKATHIHTVELQRIGPEPCGERSGPRGQVGIGKSQPILAIAGIERGE